jgi:two-component sensor histidine kinase
MQISESDAERLRRQPAILCRFGEQALHADDLDTLLQQATEAVSEAIGVRLVKALELLPEQRRLLVRAGVGWKPGVVGHATLGADLDSPAGYALQTGEPVISRDLASETRFRIPEVLRQHGVQSMVNVAIAGKRGKWGVLEVDSPEGRIFDQNDIVFLQNYANLVAAAIDRVQASRERDEILARNRILMREMQHRERNMLSNVRALARLTIRATRDLDEFAHAFDDRLGALIRTQNLLTRSAELETGLRDVLLLELEAHGVREGERFVLGGPKVVLPADTARALAMAFHELATNATKHGAFRIDGGRLDVSWTLAEPEDHETLTIRWRESGVPMAGPPARRSLGFTMIEQSVPFMIGGTSSLTFHADGLECVLCFPLKGPESPPAAAETARG